ncbi:nuclear transport factor 2 family protein [Aquimarina litoralis]|uniref:nuclear transport factor 2 family protein n=1 Tax=Aquimarina litoralis TaxID=584605 RepID=UPI001C590F7E|nr:nuclear transport factor 2 family protein [Aquimarina litoralis]MBW1296704.1 hypothetical protein [Aquimarina litoralis]
MSKIKLLSILFVFSLLNCTNKATYEIAGKKSKVIVSMIAAVNEKNAEKYVAEFAENVKVFVESEIKVNGRESLKANRANHFKNHPNVTSEIQHLVEIDDKVILHDKVWLDESDKAGQNIVEIFTFKNDKVIRVDVIQPKDLFKK